MVKKAVKKVQKTKAKVVKAPKVVKKAIKKPKLRATKTMIETLKEGTPKRK